MSLPGLPSPPSSSSAHTLSHSSQGKEEGEERSGTGTGDAEDSTDPTTTSDLPSFTANEVENLGMNEKLESVFLSLSLSLSLSSPREVKGYILTKYSSGG
jgi:hypothetical protein